MRGSGRMKLIEHTSNHSTDMPDYLRGRGGSDNQQNSIKGHLDRQQDGSVLFKVIFDVAGYSPEDLRTVLVGDRTVQVAGRANLEDRATGKHTTMSFEEHFTLPDNVDASQLRSVMASDQLVVSAPVLPPQYQARSPAATAAATFDPLGGSVGIKSPRQLQQQAQQQQQQHHQQQAQQYQSSPKSTSPTTYNMHSLGQQLQQSPLSPQPPHQPPNPHHHNHHQQEQQQLQQSTVKRYNLFQLEIDPGLEFAPSDLKISTAGAGTRLVVHGQRQIRSQGKTSFREFRDEFDLPQGLDLAKMTARLRSDGRVFVEAPFTADNDAAGAGGFTFQTLPVLHR